MAVAAYPIAYVGCVGRSRNRYLAHVAPITPARDQGSRDQVDQGLAYLRVNELLTH